MKLSLLGGILACCSLPAQTYLADDFSGASLNTSVWNAITQGIPAASISVQAGECVLTNRAHLRTVQEFDTAVIGSYSVECTFRCTNNSDIFTLFVRSDGVPSAPYFQTTNGVGLDVWLTGTPTLVVTGTLIQLGSQVISGPGLTVNAGATYTARVTDLGYKIIAHIEGPNPQLEWLSIEAPVLSDQTTAKRVTVHNREQLVASETCHIDDVRIEAMSPAAAYSLFGSGCPGPQGATPSLAPLPGSTPQIGATSNLRVAGLPMVVTVPVFIVGFSNTQASGAFGNYPLPMDLGVLGWPGCFQLVAVDLTEYAITTTGHADLAVTVPAIPLLAGHEFYVQALVLYAQGEVAVSNAVFGQVGW